MDTHPLLTENKLSRREGGRRGVNHPRNLTSPRAHPNNKECHKIGGPENLGGSKLDWNLGSGGEVKRENIEYGMIRL